MGLVMAMSEWTELEALSRKLADAEARLARARSTQNHGLVALLEKEIAAAEILRDRAVSQLAVGLTSRSRQAVPHEASVSEVALPPTQSPAPAIQEGASAVWNSLSRSDLERVKSELNIRRSQMLARHAEELKPLDGEMAEIETFEQVIDALVRKFNIGSAEVVSLERVLSQAG